MVIVDISNTHSLQIDVPNGFITGPCARLAHVDVLEERLLSLSSLQDDLPFLKIFGCHLIDDIREGPNVPKYLSNFRQVCCIDMKFVWLKRAFEELSNDP